ncbi:MAG: DUF1858 domain-containing protein [archaeon]|nr:DUF1858 domain-containing protein [archaeon]MCR4323525.1 DUF1858 domain-containing protein [Nanoarchaeota archaeon]
MKNKKITRHTKFADLVDSNSEAMEILAEEGLGCGMCPMAQFETIEQGAIVHGIDPEELVAKLNSKKKDG